MSKRNTWTRDEIIKEARKHKTRKRLVTKNKHVYYRALKEGLLEIAFKNDPMKGRSKRANNYWTEEKIKGEAKKYPNRNEMKQRVAGAYRAAVRLGILHELFHDSEKGGYLKYPNGYWTYNRCKKESRKYETKGEFQEKNGSAYAVARENGWLEDLCRHMRVVGNRYWRYIYVLADLKTKRAYIGLSHDPKARHNGHMRSRRKEMCSFSKGAKLKILSSLLSPKDAANKEREVIAQFASRGWVLMNVKGGGALGTHVSRWTYRELQVKANKVNTRQEYKEKYPEARLAAQRMGVMNKLFQKHKNEGYSIRQMGTLSKAELKRIAAHCKDRYEFGARHSSAYTTAVKMNILDELFKSHPRNGYRRNRKKK